MDPRGAVPLQLEPTPQPVYLQRPQDYQSDTPMIDGSLDLVAWLVERALRIAATIGSVLLVLAIWAIILYPFDLQNSPLALLGPLGTFGCVLYPRVAERFPTQTAVFEAKLKKLKEWSESI